MSYAVTWEKNTPGKEAASFLGPETVCAHVSETKRGRGEVTGEGAAYRGGEHTYFAGPL